MADVKVSLMLIRLKDNMQQHSTITICILSITSNKRRVCMHQKKLNFYQLLHSTITLSAAAYNNNLRNLTNTYLIPKSSQTKFHKETMLEGTIIA